MRAGLGAVDRQRRECDCGNPSNSRAYRDSPGRLNGTVTTVTDATGLAIYNDLKIQMAGTYTLQASTASVSALSNPFTITPATSGQTHHGGGAAAIRAPR